MRSRSILHCLSSLDAAGRLQEALKSGCSDSGGATHVYYPPLLSRFFHLTVQSSKLPSASEVAAEYYPPLLSHDQGTLILDHAFYSKEKVWPFASA